MKNFLAFFLFIAPIVLGILLWGLTGNVYLGLAALIVFLMPAIVLIYIPYAHNNPHHFWFKRKLFGWGWTPVTWQGWLVIACYVAGLVYLFVRIDRASHSASDTLYGILVPFLVFTAVLIAIGYWKGEPPRWQWGPEDDEPTDTQA